MPVLPKLSPLQSRLAACLIASLMVLVLYFALSLPHFAYAADVDSMRGEDHNHERLLDMPFLEVDIEELELREIVYEAEFIVYDRGIMGRASTVYGPTVLINNCMDLTNVDQGQTVSYSFLKASVFGDLSPSPRVLPSPVKPRSRNTELGDKEGTADGGSEETGKDEEYTEDLKLRLRQSTTANYRTVYITVNTCGQPQPIINSTTDPPPQLQLYVSLALNNTNPGPGKDSTTQQMVILEGGAGMIAVNATGDVFIGLYGQTTTAYKDAWSAEIAASIDAPYHYYHNGTSPNLFLVDSDSNSALLVTGDLTNEPENSTVYQEWMDSAAPFVLFVINQDESSLQGLENSYCALQQKATIGPKVTTADAKSVRAGITTRGNKQPKQQFYIDSLKRGYSYNAVLAISGNSTNSGNGVVGGGGQVWPMTNFTTLSGMCLSFSPDGQKLIVKDGNCAMIFDLSFCSQIAYAVPANPKIFQNFTALAAFYDNATQASYKFFENVLAQIPCETTASAQYSLARTCSDCAAAYQEWLCTVSMPRCTDFLSNLPWLQARNMGQPFPNGTMLPPDLVAWANNSAPLNSSRNPNIDAFVRPGPYKEVLPCDGVCYNLVQSCPASMGFACPQPGGMGFNQSYGVMSNPSIPEQVGQMTCNYPTAASGQISGGVRASSGHILAFVVMAVTGLVFI